VAQDEDPEFKPQYRKKKKKKIEEEISRKHGKKERLRMKTNFSKLLHLVVLLD
jgi:hypothetical protein